MKLLKYFRGTNNTVYKAEADNWWGQAKCVPFNVKIAADIMHVIGGDVATNRSRVDSDLHDDDLLCPTNCWR